jgi:hypothetical protein
LRRADERKRTKLTDEQFFWRAAFPKAPTGDRFHRHAEKFGPEGIREIASFYGIDRTVKTARPVAKKRRRTSDELRHQVVDLPSVVFGRLRSRTR